MTAAQAQRVAADLAVAYYVQQDGLHAATSAQTDPPWGLDGTTPTPARAACARPPTPLATTSHR
ncbi:hypothetical protein [Streptomyces sp. NPDC004330]|uniref:hypothetical protein n=1 Tax=Streptomyces sp. NPDC004330 TaxID=3364700 RepID=UPI003677ED40